MAYQRTISKNGVFDWKAPAQSVSRRFGLRGNQRPPSHHPGEGLSAVKFPSWRYEVLSAPNLTFPNLFCWHCLFARSTSLELCTQKNGLKIQIPRSTAVRNPQQTKSQHQQPSPFPTPVPMAMQSVVALGLLINEGVQLCVHRGFLDVLLRCLDSAERCRMGLEDGVSSNQVEFPMNNWDVVGIK